MSQLLKEITFKTARSGGKGGQNVNKVETMVEGYWHVERSAFFRPEEKQRLTAKLSKKINAEGFLLVKSQAKRTQLENKEEVIKKINVLVKGALVISKIRKPTKPGLAAKEGRINSKKKLGAVKELRKKILKDA